MTDRPTQGEAKELLLDLPVRAEWSNANCYWRLIDNRGEVIGRLRSDVDAEAVTEFINASGQRAPLSHSAERELSEIKERHTAHELYLADYHMDGWRPPAHADRGRLIEMLTESYAALGRAINVSLSSGWILRKENLVLISSNTKLQAEVTRLRQLQQKLIEIGAENVYGLHKRLTAELAEAKAEEESSTTQIIHLGNLLSGVVNALKGEPGPCKWHSTHNAPEVARAVMTELAEAKAELGRVREAASVILDVFLPNPEPGENAYVEHMALEKLRHALSSAATREEPTGPTTYRGYNIRPLTSRIGTWYGWEIDGYDGAPDSPTRNHWGRAKSIEACREAIDDLLEGSES